MINITAMSRLHSGAIWQLNTDILQVDDWVMELQAKNQILEQRLALLEQQQVRSWFTPAGESIFNYNPSKN